MKNSLKIMKFLVAILFVAVGMGALQLGFFEGLAGIMVAAPLVLASIENSDDAKARRSKIWDDMQGLIQKRKDEKRAFDEDEQKRYDLLKSDFDRLTDHIKDLESDEKRALIMAGKEARKQQQRQEKREVSQYNLKRALELVLANKQLDGLEGEMHQEAVNEARGSGKSIEGNLGIPSVVLDVLAKRSMSVGGTTSATGDQGGMLVPTETSGLIMALRPRLVLAQLGANFMGNLVGNLDFVKGTSTVATWNTETGGADETSIGTSKVSMSPKRLAAYTAIYKQLMNQTPENLESKVMNDLFNAIAQAVEAAAIAGTGENNQPLGILNTTGIGSVVGHADNGASPTWDHIVDLESKVDIANALMGQLAYLTNAKVKGKLKRTKLDDGSGLFVYPQSENSLNGYPVGVTNLVPSNFAKGGGSPSGMSAILFGDWSELMIGQWGGLDLTVDPYTGAKNAKIEIVTNSFWDVGTTFPEKFAAMIDALTT